MFAQHRIVAIKSTTEFTLLSARLTGPMFGGKSGQDLEHSALHLGTLAG
jgi:hypothetical protein